VSAPLDLQFSSRDWPTTSGAPNHPSVRTTLEALPAPHAPPTTADNTGIISSSPRDGDADQPPVPELAHPYRTWLQNDIKKPKIHTDGMVTYSVVQSSKSKLSSQVAAMEHPLWHRAIYEEFEALIKNNTWHLVSPRVGINVIDSKWVFKLKHKPDGSIDCYEARSVAKGFKHQYGVDYDDTSSPVVKPTTIHLLLSLVVSRGWCLQQIDIQNAFFHGLLHEVVYTKQPLAWRIHIIQIICASLTNLYMVLNRPPHAWFSCLSGTLIQLGFQATKADVSLFIFHREGI
jgi:hypothetical protein